MTEIEEHQIFLNKRTDKTYLSKAITQKQLAAGSNLSVDEINRYFRIISKVINCKEGHEFIVDGKEICLRVTDGFRHEIIAKFYEDNRGIFVLTIQKYSSDTGIPHKTYFTFIDDEIITLFNFIKNIAVVPIENKSTQQFLDTTIQQIALSKAEAIKQISQDPDLVEEIIKSNISKAEIIGLRHRKEQLKVFHDLLNDPIKFAEKKGDTLRDESVWQQFFEQNSWIFGYGLNYTFNSALPEKKLEQVVSGFTAFSRGKRIDALMQTKGIISSLCFGEIKIHTTRLLDSSSKAYRPESYAISDELAGGVAQVQKTVHKALQDLNTRLDLKNESGDPIGQTVFLCQPKAFLVIGSLKEFKTENGINEDRYSSFELFRRNINNPEIITFDELYERAKYIVELSDML